MIGKSVIVDILNRWMNEHDILMTEERADQLAVYIDQTLIAMTQQGHIPDATTTSAALRILERQVADVDDLVVRLVPSGLLQAEIGDTVAYNLSEQAPLQDAIVQLARQVVRKTS